MCSAARRGRNQRRLVGAGPALPLKLAGEAERGQGKPSPYETREMFAKKTRIYGIAMQTAAIEVCGSYRAIGA